VFCAHTINPSPVAGARQRYHRHGIQCGVLRPGVLRDGRHRDLGSWLLAWRLALSKEPVFPDSAPTPAMGRGSIPLADEGPGGPFHVLVHNSQKPQGASAYGYSLAGWVELDVIGWDSLRLHSQLCRCHQRPDPRLWQSIGRNSRSSSSQAAMAHPSGYSTELKTTTSLVAWLVERTGSMRSFVPSFRSDHDLTRVGAADGMRDLTTPSSFTRDCPLSAGICGGGAGHFWGIDAAKPSGKFPPPCSFFKCTHRS
jgi:hypothetical protein